MFVRSLLFLVLLCSKDALGAYIAARSDSCEVFHSNFPQSSVSPAGSFKSSPFTAISPEGSYRINGDGIELFLEKPAGPVETKHGVNDKVASGATINSTFTILYGKVTFDVSAPKVPGVVTAVILLADQKDEIDVELLGGYPNQWQTNIFAPSPKDKAPLWGVFGGIEDLPASNASINNFHTYTIDWKPEYITWAVDGKAVRTIHKDQTEKNGALHFPSHAARIQLGIWDASSPAGTAEWAKGPIDWEKAPERMTAVVRSVTVECT